MLQVASCQPWQKKLKKSGNDYAPGVTTACQPRTVEKVFYWKPQPFQSKLVSVEMVDPNRTRP